MGPQVSVDPATPPAEHDSAAGGASPSATLSSPVPPTPMVRVERGKFTMGCPPKASSLCRDDEKPAHEVELSAFEIDVYEATAGQYKACCDAGACSCTPTDGGGSARFDRLTRVCREQFRPEFARRPVVCVSAFEAADFCAWQGKRLPTEAEWERAARGDDGRLFPWGDVPPTAERACMGGDAPCDVGQYAAGVSPVGAHDMAGNAAEWVSDMYHPHYYAMSPATDPDGFHEVLPVRYQVCQDATCRIARGGSWKSPIDELRSTARSAHSTNLGPWWQPYIGFRCARSGEPTK